VRYSDQGSVSLAPCDTSVDWKRIDDNTILGELIARTLLRDVHCNADGESRSEEEAMVVVLRFFVTNRNRRTCPPNHHFVRGPDGPLHRCGYSHRRGG
jgi:hypothetical protein